jgi:hypothetical protein
MNPHGVSQLYWEAQLRMSACRESWSEAGHASRRAARLRTIGRKVEILDSHRAGKVGKVYCANDRVDAIKIARIYLSALSPIVWQPDAKTLERREIFSAYQAVVKESTRAKQQLRAMLNEHCVRLEKGFRLCHPNAIRRLVALREWTPARTSCCNSCTALWWPRERVARCCADTWPRRSWPRKRCCD